jgi:hypothetical protein
LPVPEPEAISRIPTPLSLQKKTVKELKTLAKTAGLKKYSKLKKTDLIILLTTSPHQEIKDEIKDEISIGEITPDEAVDLDFPPLLDGPQLATYNSPDGDVLPSIILEDDILQDIVEIRILNTQEIIRVPREQVEFL